MTRINCIPVEELHNKHLVAEYRELPRALTLAVKHIKKPVGITWYKFPAAYTMGTGHVRFFYNRLKYLEQRYSALIVEMQRRGFEPKAEVFGKVLNSFQRAEKDHPSYYNDWEPDEAAKTINRQRINERLKEMKS